MLTVKTSEGKEASSSLGVKRTSDLMEEAAAMVAQASGFKKLSVAKNNRGRDRQTDRHTRGSHARTGQRLAPGLKRRTDS